MPLNYPSDVLANAMVATSQPIAAQVGRDILERGGNAVDAAIATAAALTVVEPTSNGIGGDIFAQIWINGELHGLNASSVAPAMMTPKALADRGHTKSVPPTGIEPVTVPGTPAAWASLHERWGTLPLTELLAPAVDLARSGFEVTPTVAILWQKEFEKYQQAFGNSALMSEWAKVFTINNAPPKAGTQFILSDHGDTLEELAATQCKSFYLGDLADKIDVYSKQLNGFIRKSDLASYAVEWVKPISTQYRGIDIWQMPPNGQGLVLLMALNILEKYRFSSDNLHSLDTLHKQIEAMKLAYTDGQAYITQADKMTTCIDSLLSKNYADQRRQLITETALNPFKGEPASGGTVYLATADQHGNMVSLMQSNFYGFGSGVVVPNTGIALHSRGYDFSLDPAHPNFLEPGKRTFHTIIPGFMSQQVEGKQHAIGPFGVMGAYMQPQGQLQVIMNMLDFGMTPQEALNRPRWQWFGDKRVGIEKGFDQSLFDGLQARSHDIHWAEDETLYGRGQIIMRNQNQDEYNDYNYIGGTEPRCDGQVTGIQVVDIKEQ